MVKMEYFSRSRSVSTLSHSHSLSLGKIHKREKRLRSLHNISTVRLRYNKQAEHSQPVLCCHFFFPLTLFERTFQNFYFTNAKR